VSIGCLVGAFGYPLQKLEIYRQIELGQFGLPYEKTFVLTENDLNYPYGFNKQSAQLIAQIYQDYKLQKIMLLVLAGLCASYAMNMGTDTVANAEIDSEVSTIKSQGKKELILEKVKHRLAMASKSQRLLFIDEMKALVEEFGSPEGEILEADEVNATDKFVNASYLLGEGHSVDTVVQQTWNVQPGTVEHSGLKQKFLAWQSDESGDSAIQTIPDESSFREQFPENMDATSWKAICKAVQGGASKDEIIKDVLGGSDAAQAYYEFLKGKFLK
jgi:hypothetical protein